MTHSEPQTVRELPNVGTILQAVSSRRAPDEFIPAATEEFGRMVRSAGVGRNANVEFVVCRRKLGDDSLVLATEVARYYVRNGESSTGNALFSRLALH